MLNDADKLCYEDVFNEFIKLCPTDTTPSILSIPRLDVFTFRVVTLLQ